MTDTPTAPEIAAAIAWGQQLAVRTILDQLAKHRPQRSSWVADREISTAAAKGYADAERIVRGYQVDGSAGAAFQAAAADLAAIVQPEAM